jgi:uncharacterized protein
VTAYLDASVLVALFTVDALSSRADAWLRDASPILIVSDFAAAETASAVALRVRTGALNVRQARKAFASFDEWTARETTRVRMAAADVTSAEAWLRRLDVTLRTPDAVNIAIAQRCGASLATFDVKMAAVAHTLGVEVIGL